MKPTIRIMGPHYLKQQDFRLLHDDCLEVLDKVKPESITTIFADPPYNLSNGGISCKAGRMVSVNKADWDKSNGFDEDYAFTYAWLEKCHKVLKPEGTIWVSGTMHNIYQVGHALQSLGFKILNEIIWYKPNAPPNLACRSFAHAHETIIWAKKDKKNKHKFNYREMKEWDDKITPSGKQMRSIWHIPLTSKAEKVHGAHPTQKPLELLRRIIISSSDKGDWVLDPFNGSGTTGIVAKKLGRKYVGIDKEKKYLEITFTSFIPFFIYLFLQATFAELVHINPRTRSISKRLININRPATMPDMNARFICSCFSFNWVFV